MRLNKISLAALVLGGSALLSACGGGGGGGDSLRPVSLATTDTFVQIKAADLSASQAAVQSVLGKSFTFPTSVWDSTLTGSSALTLTSDKAAPDFSLTVPGETQAVTGTMSYGSCIFTIKISPFVAPHPLAAPKEIRIADCSLSVSTNSRPADGTLFSSSVTFKLNGASSAVTLPVSISSTGVVTVNGSIFGSTTVVVTTGAAN